MSEQEDYRRKYRNAAAILVGLVGCCALFFVLYAYNAGEKHGYRVGWAAAKTSARLAATQCDISSSEVQTLKAENNSLRSEIKRLEGLAPIDQSNAGGAVCEASQDQCEGLIESAVQEAIAESDCREPYEPLETEY